MSLDHPTWKGRRKRPSRRLMYDLRAALPLAGIVFCFAISATAIFATEWIPSRSESPPPVSAPRAVEAGCPPATAEVAILAPLAASLADRTGP